MNKYNLSKVLNKEEKNKSLTRFIDDIANTQNVLVVIELAYYLHLYSHFSTANESRNNIKPTLQFCLYVVSGHLWIIFNYLLR